MFFSSRKAPLRGGRRTTWRVVLGGTPAMVGLVVLAAASLAEAQSPGEPTETLAVSGNLIGDFRTIAPAPLLTLSDSVSGDAAGLGNVTGGFTVTIDFNKPLGNGLVLVTKVGSLVAADGDRIDLAMAGTFNVTTFDVHYIFVVTGGTGRFAGAPGIGTWHVPPPTTFDPATGSGSGDEIFQGAIILPEED